MKKMRCVSKIWFALMAAIVQVSLCSRQNDSSALFKVLRTVPHQRTQLAYLEQLEHNDTDSQINFWTSPTRLGGVVDFMIPATHLERMQQELFLKGLSSSVIINDVEKLVSRGVRKRKFSD